MKAVVFERYGAPDVLQVKDVDTPAPKDNEVRIEVHATSVTAAEGMMRRGDTFMSRYSRPGKAEEEVQDPRD